MRKYGIHKKSNQNSSNFTTGLVRIFMNKSLLCNDVLRHGMGTYLSFFLLGVYNTFVVSTVLQVCKKEFAEVTQGLM